MTRALGKDASGRDKLPIKEARRIVDDYDGDCDGKLSRKEFAAYIAEEDAQEMFRTLDADGTGTLKGPEMRNLAEMLHRKFPHVDFGERLGKQVIMDEGWGGDCERQNDAIFLRFGEGFGPKTSGIV